MKRMICLCLTLILTLSLVPAQVRAVINSVICYPGNTIDVVLSLAEDGDQPDGVMGRLSFDTDIFTLLPSKDVIGMDGINILNRQPVTLSFRVNQFAPAGQYTIDVKVIEAYDADGKKYTNVRINPVQVTVMSPATAAPEHTPAPTSTGKPLLLPSTEGTSRRQIKAGDYVTFGRYPQTAEGNDQTPIEWLVLSYLDDYDCVLLLSRYGLDAKPYHNENTSVTWENCTLRSWLNGEFFGRAFNASEQQEIFTASLNNGRSAGYGDWNTDGGNDTKDRVFLLSYKEVNGYLGVQHWSVEGADKNMNSRVSPTEYAKKQGAWTTRDYLTTEGRETGWWWLRSPGTYQYYAADVYAGGFLGTYEVKYDYAIVRPALFVSVDAVNISGTDVSQEKNRQTQAETGSGSETHTGRKTIAAGDYVTFGRYPQTAAGNDQTPIEWLVLEVQGNKALLLSRYGLDAKPYNGEFVDITWEKSTLRAWLNQEFLKKAFSSTEQKAILTTAVDNSSSQGYSEWSTSGGNNTQDKIFLLSYGEAKKYLGVTWEDRNNMKSRVALTGYAYKRVYKWDDNKTAEGTAAGRWWLRSPGYYQDCAAFVLNDGSLGSNLVYDDSGCVRPAMWVNLDSGIF